MNAPRILVTGAPGSAKTKFIEKIKLDKEFSHFVFLDELARIILQENSDLRDHPAELHCEIYRRQVAREDELTGRAFITDRGTIDGFAFHRASMELIGTSLKKEYERYTSVIHLGTAAGLGEEFYETDDIRQESPARTMAVETALAELWGAHPDYNYLEPHTEIEKKYEKFVQLVRKLAI
jgi:predicted ATPase